MNIEPAPDEWDRLYNVDFFIKIGERFIGLQIKPVTFGGDAPQLPEIFKEKSIHGATHKVFSEKFGGKVFYVYSAKIGAKKEICNPEVIGAIKAEMKRLA